MSSQIAHGRRGSRPVRQERVGKTFARKKHARLNTKQNRAHHRLKHLYAISKHLATFENVEEGFPKLLTLAAEAFPLASAVLVEKRGEIPKTTIWPTKGLERDQIKTAITRAQ